VLENAHVGSSEDKSDGHADGDAMMTAIESRYKWSNMKLDIDDWVRLFCHVIDTSHRVPTPPRKSWIFFFKIPGPGKSWNWNITFVLESPGN